MFHAIMSLLSAIQIFMAAVSFMGLYEDGGWRMAVSCILCLAAGIWTAINAVVD